MKRINVRVEAPEMELALERIAKAETQIQNDVWELCNLFRITLKQQAEKAQYDFTIDIGERERLLSDIRKNLDEVTKCHKELKEKGILKKEGKVNG